MSVFPTIETERETEKERERERIKDYAGNHDVVCGSDGSNDAESNWFRIEASLQEIVSTACPIFIVAHTNRSHKMAFFNSIQHGFTHPPIIPQNT